MLIAMTAKASLVLIPLQQPSSLCCSTSLHAGSWNQTHLSKHSLVDISCVSAWRVCQNRYTGKAAEVVKAKVVSFYFKLELHQFAPETQLALKPK